nr:hypothetical protein [Burkholderia stagnalis]
MSDKSAAVHFDTSDRAHARLAFASRLALRFGAHLTGLTAVYRTEPGSFQAMAGSANCFREHRERPLFVPYAGASLLSRAYETGTGPLVMGAYGPCSGAGFRWAAPRVPCWRR